MKKVYTSVDIGSDTIKLVVAEYYNNNYYVLAAHTIKSRGIRKGLIVDSNLAVTAIKDGMKVINEKLGMTITKVLVNVPDYNAKFMVVTGATIVNEIITTDDINRSIKDSVYNKIAKNYELVTVMPLEFKVDEEIIKEKIIGKKASKLEVKGIMVSVPKKNVYSVIETMENAGLEVVDIVLSGMADYFEVKNNYTDSHIGAIINLGHETTNVSVYNHGKLMNTETIQLGGFNVDKDLSYVFGINVFDGRTLKEKFASSHKRFISLNDVCEIKNNYGESIKLNQLEVTEVVMSRMTEILELAKKQILMLSKQNIKYIIITGGLTEIKSFKNLVFEIISKDVIIYKENEIGIRDNKYITAIGMIKYFVSKMDIRGKDYSMITSEDEELLISPKKRNIKDNWTTKKIFDNFFKSKEEK